MLKDEIERIIGGIMGEEIIEIDTDGKVHKPKIEQCAHSITQLIIDKIPKEKEQQILPVRQQYYSEQWLQGHNQAIQTLNKELGIG